MNSKEEGSESLKDWILKEMVSGRKEDQSVIAKMLSGCKDDVRKLIIIRDDGKITLQKYDLPVKHQVLLYLLGAAYARVAETRQDDTVPNKELIEELRLKDAETRARLTELRKSGQIVQEERGLHRINYKKLSDIITDINAKK